MAELRALILDFDGLVVDTETPEFRSWQEVFASYGARLELTTWARVIGSGGHSFDPYAELERALGEPVDRDRIRGERRARFAELMATQTALPGVEAMVRAARRRGLRLAIASSSDRTWVTRHLAPTGLTDEFEVLATADDVRLTKPSPEVYEAALAGLGVRADEACAFEDSPNGVAAAKAAGLFCVVVPNDLTRELDTSAADLRLDALTGLVLDDLRRART